MIPKAAARVLHFAARTATAAQRLIQGGRHSLDKAELLADARRRTGLDDFGDAPFEDGLSRFLDAVGPGDKLTDLGRSVVRAECLRILCNRLLMEEVRVERPEISAVTIERPVFIIGLPRSGTTFLHHVLGGAPGYRAPTLAEMLYPASAARGRRLTLGQRAGVQWLRLLKPRLGGIHAVRLDYPEECTFLLQHSFRSLVLGTALDAPAYVVWLVGQDLTDAYAFHRWQLQLLTGDDTERTWVLKSPAHAFALDIVAEQYPDARFIQLHRDPAEVLPSFCSLREVLLDGVLKTPSPSEIGKHSAIVMRAAAGRLLASRSKLDSSCVLDLRFDELMAAPEEVAKRALDFLDPERPNDVDRAVRASIRNTPPRRGRHPNDLERYGLSASRVAEQFRSYREWSTRVTQPGVERAS